MDPEALEIARENVASVEMEEHIDFLHAEIAPVGSAPSNEGIPVLDRKALGRTFDTVVMKCVSCVVEVSGRT